jgi:hypothetical protein
MKATSTYHSGERLLFPCVTVLADAMFLPSGHFAREMISRDYKSQAATRSTGAK